MSWVTEFLVSPDLTPREAARRLGTSEATIWKLIADGRLPTYRLSPKPGAARRIRWEGVEAIRRGVDPVEAVQAADRVITRLLDQATTMEPVQGRTIHGFETATPDGHVARNPERRGRI